jgi:hypothetical protein
MRGAAHDPIRVGRWFQGPTGSGQGGWTAHQLAKQIDHPVTMAIKAPVPLETDLDVVHDLENERWLLVDHSSAVTVMVAEPWEATFADTAPVSIDDATEARSRFETVVDEHPVPFCFSCGLQHDSMRVHAGPLDDDRFATDWRAPDWAIANDGTVDPGTLWAAIDCTAAWYVGYSRGPRTPLTVQYAVEVLHPIEPGVTYALVGWSGDHSSNWDGRKRHGASAAFAPDGTCVARSVSFWLSVPL